MKDANGVEDWWVRQITARVRGLKKVLVALYHAPKQKSLVGF